MPNQLVRGRSVRNAGSSLAVCCAFVVGCSANTENTGANGSAGMNGSGAGGTSATGGASGSGNPGASGAGGSAIAGSSSAGTSSAGAAGMAASGTGNSGAGAGGLSSGGASGGPGGTTNMAGSAGTAPTCAPACGANAKCEAATHSCVCSPGFVSQGGGTCTAAPVGDPSTHTQADVCSRWKEGHVVTEPRPLTASGGECDPGTLKPGAITDTLVRINLFRWLEGLGPVTDDAQYDSDAQACSNLEAWWDFTSTGSPHQPPNTSQCYTSVGGATAGQSNISWGAGSPAQSIDQYMEDNGNDTTLGHRRWLMNPPLNPVGVGYWQTGGKYGNASCLRVFSSKGTGPKPSWNAVPPAGFSPIQMAKFKQWSFEGSLAGIAKATATVLRVEDNTPLAVTQQALSQGYGQDTMSFKPNGWTAEAGKTYRVTISGLGAGNVVYDVKPVACN